MRALCICGWKYPESPAREVDGALRAHLLTCGRAEAVLLEGYRDQYRIAATLERDILGRIVAVTT